MSEAPLSEHLEDLKRCIGTLLVLLIAAFSLCWFFSDPLYDLLIPSISTPFTEIKTARASNPSDQITWVNLPERASIEGKSVVSPYPLYPHSEVEFSYPNTNTLVCLSPLEGFFTALKIAFWSCVLLSSPLWLYILFQFVAPALRANEKKLVGPLLLALLATGIVGFYLAYSYVIPFATDYFYQVNTLFGVNFWSLDAYVDYVLMLYLCTTLLLEIVALLVVFIMRGFVTHEQLAKRRKIAYLLAFIFGAFLTPPDVFSQTIAALFLIGAFEGCLLFSYFLRT